MPLLVTMLSRTLTNDAQLAAAVVDYLHLMRKGSCTPFLPSTHYAARPGALNLVCVAPGVPLFFECFIPPSYYLKVDVNPGMLPDKELEIVKSIAASLWLAHATETSNYLTFTLHADV